MDAIAVLGQSNADRIWTDPYSAPAAAADTHVWSPSTSSWATPTNSLVLFCNALKAKSGKPVYVIPGALGGTYLVRDLYANPTPATLDRNWLNYASSTSVISAFLAMLEASGANLMGMSWTQGEDECATPTTMEKYLASLGQLHALIAAAIGRRPENLPFLISPVGNAAKFYPYGRPVVEAQILAPKTFPGMLPGPRYDDLAVDSGSVHMTADGRNTYCTRLADAFVPIVGVAPQVTQGGSGAALQEKNGSFLRDVSLTTPYSVTNVGFQPKTVEFRASIAATHAQSDGVDDGVTSSHTRDSTYDGSPYNTDPGHSICLVVAASTYLQGKIASMDSDGFTLSFVKTGSPAGLATVSWRALG